MMSCSQCKNAVVSMNCPMRPCRYSSLVIQLSVPPVRCQLCEKDKRKRKKRKKKKRYQYLFLDKYFSFVDAISGRLADTLSKFNCVYCLSIDACQNDGLFEFTCVNAINMSQSQEYAQNIESYYPMSGRLANAMNSKSSSPPATPTQTIFMAL